MAEQSRNHPRVVSMAKRLRRDATPAEEALWKALRGLDGPRWRRQAPIGHYIADFACLAARLIVELDGGAHNAPDVAIRDTKKQKWLESEGFEVIRFPNARVLANASGVADELHTTAIARLPAPSRGGAGGGGTGRSTGRDLEGEFRLHPEKDVSGRTTAPPPPAPPREGAGRPSRRSRHDLSESTAPPQIDPSTLVIVGAIAGAFGVKGEVRVRSFTAAPEGVVSYGPLYDAQGRVVLTPKRWRDIKDGLAVSGPEIKDRNAAEAARGTPLHVPRDVMPPAEEDEYYHVDLIGCRVEALDGAVLGHVHAVHDFGAGDILEVKPPAGPNWYLDFTKASVPVVDLANDRVVATAPVSEPAEPE